MIMYSPWIVNLSEMVAHYRVGVPRLQVRQPDSYPLGAKSDALEPPQYRGLDTLCHNQLVNPKDVTFLFQYISVWCQYKI